MRDKTNENVNKIFYILTHVGFIVGQQTYTASLSLESVF